MTLESLTHESFQPHEGETFQLSYAELAAPLHLELVEAKPVGSEKKNQSRQSFSLVFRHRDSTPDHVLVQRIYHLKHEELGELDMFLVPVGEDPDGNGMLYEAVFT